MVFIGFRAQQRKSLLQMQFRLKYNVAICTLFVMHQRLQMQQLLTELNIRMQIMIWFRVFILYNQLGFFSLFIFWTIQFLNFGPLIYYRTFFFIVLFSNFLIHPYLYIFHQYNIFLQSHLFNGYMVNYTCLLFHNFLSTLDVRIKI